MPLGRYGSKDPVSDTVLAFLVFIFFTIIFLCSIILFSYVKKEDTKKTEIKMYIPKKEKVSKIDAVNKCNCAMLKWQISVKDLDLQAEKLDVKRIKDGVEKLKNDIKQTFSVWLKDQKPQDLIKQNTPAVILSYVKNNLEGCGDTYFFNLLRRGLNRVVFGRFGKYMSYELVHEGKNFDVYLNKFRAFAKNPQNLKNKYCQNKASIKLTSRTLGLQEKLQTKIGFAIKFFNEELTIQERNLYNQWSTLDKGYDTNYVEFRKFGCKYIDNYYDIKDCKGYNIQTRILSEEGYYLYKFVIRRYNDYGQQNGKQVVQMVAMILKDLLVSLKGQKTNFCGNDNVVTTKPTTLPTTKPINAKF